MEWLLGSATIRICYWCPSVLNSSARSLAKMEGQNFTITSGLREHVAFGFSPGRYPAYEGERTETDPILQALRGAVAYAPQNGSIR